MTIKKMTSNPSARNGRIMQVTLSASILLVCGVVGCIVPKVDIKPPKETTVTTAVVKASTIPRRYNFTGTLQAVKSVDIMSQVTGYIKSRDFVEGSIVKQGQLLYQIDPRPFQAKLDAAVAQKQQDEASLAYWKIEVERYTALAKKGAGSVEKQQSTKARVAELQAAVQKDIANIESAKLNLGFTRIAAPFDARIQATNFNIGALVKENVDKLTTAIQVDPIYVLFNVSRKQITEIQSYDLQKTDDKDPSSLEGSKVTLTLPDGTQYKNTGSVDYLSAQIDSSTDMLSFRAVFKNNFQGGDQVELLPGQYCPLTLDLGEIKGALLIPQSALVQGQAGDQVFVVGADNKVSVVDVVIGATHEDFFIVKSGIKDGDRVISAGTQKVRPGITVKISDATTPKAAAK